MDQLKPFEGLVHTTARMFAAQVKREEEDLAQELRVRVWRAVQTWNPSRSRMSLERYVFSAVANKIKDYKRDAARERDRREECGLTFLHIEDMTPGAMEGSRQGDPRPSGERFDSMFNFVERDEVYRRVDEGKLVLPANVTKCEANVLVLLMMELSRPEVAVRLSLTVERVDACLVALREKFADWRPSQRENSSQAVSLRDAALAVAA